MATALGELVERLNANSGKAWVSHLRGHNIGRKKPIAIGVGHVFPRRRPTLFESPVCNEGFRKRGFATFFFVPRMPLAFDAESETRRRRAHRIHRMFNVPSPICQEYSKALWELRCWALLGNASDSRLLNTFPLVELRGRAHKTEDLLGRAMLLWMA